MDWDPSCLPSVVHQPTHGFNDASPSYILPRHWDGMVKLESDTEYLVANWTVLSEASQPYTQIAFFPFRRQDYWGKNPS